MTLIEEDRPGNLRSSVAILLARVVIPLWFGIGAVLKIMDGSPSNLPAALVKWLGGLGVDLRFVLEFSIAVELIVVGVMILVPGSRASGRDPDARVVSAGAHRRCRARRLELRLFRRGPDSAVGHPGDRCVLPSLPSLSRARCPGIEDASIACRHGRSCPSGSGRCSASRWRSV